VIPKPAVNTTLLLCLTRCRVATTFEKYVSPCNTPLDYEDPSAGTTDVAYIKYESKKGTGQDIIFNPGILHLDPLRKNPLIRLGGPGASGVDYPIRGKSYFIRTFRSDYNFVSFDPRGVNNTGPVLSCGLEKRASHTSPYQEQWAQAKANGQYCTKYNAKTKALYAGTVANVKDMMHFTELQAKANGHPDSPKAKIWYYGVSYGTLLDQTLATLYPARLGLMILDSNVYGIQHYQGYEPSAVLDTDKIFKFSFKYCYEAGPSLCPLASNANSPWDIERRYQNILQQLGEEPYITPNSTNIFTRHEAEMQAFLAMYSPRKGFYTLARQIANLEAGDLSELSELSDILHNISRDGITPSASEAGAYKDKNDVRQLIDCIDTARNYALHSLRDYHSAIAEIFSTSRYGAEAMAYSNPLLCAGITLPPPKSQLFPGFRRTNTSVPILFINNSADPITPMAAAVKMAKFFEGARVLRMDAPGHSMLSMPSECVKVYARKYLRSGELPLEGEFSCGVDIWGKEVFEEGRWRFESVRAARRK
jgi:pimeloyl-ACP methyl ester carboxylesterase